jgi:DNA-binding beta-propeller fold protein YncE
MEGCAVGIGLRGAADIAITRDGTNLYVASARSNAVAAFTRSVGSGQLQQLAGEAACTAEQEADEDVDEDEGPGLPAEGCHRGRGLTAAIAVAASPDGKNVYVLASDAIAAFRRGPGGALTQLPGRQGCLAVDGRGGACTTVPQLENGLDLSISPDGRHLYVSAVEPIGFSCACGRELGSLSVFTRSTVSVSLAGPRTAAVVRAGRAFRITARVRTSASAVKVSCSTSAGGRKVRATGTYAAGAAICAGILPKGAVGRLVGTLSVTAGGATGRASFSFPIR